MSAALAPPDIPVGGGGPGGGVAQVSAGGTAGAWSGGYHLPSEASHHPGPCDWSLMDRPYDAGRADSPARRSAPRSSTSAA